jgi:ribosomal protein S18 acetylase RimI-like enzyme
MYRVHIMDSQALKKKPVVKSLKAITDYIKLAQSCFNELPVREARDEFPKLGSALDRVIGVSADDICKVDLSRRVIMEVALSEVIAVVLDAEGRVVAGCTTRFPRGGAGERNEIDSVCVAPEVRGKGVCRTLVAAVAKFYKDRGDDVGIVCETNNPAACACYRSVFKRSRLEAKPDPRTGERIRRFTGIRDLEGVRYVKK